jgi:hypothetical protein
MPAVFRKAEAMAMQGEEVAAFQLLDQALESKQRWRFSLTDVANPLAKQPFPPSASRRFSAGRQFPDHQ